VEAHETHREPSPPGRIVNLLRGPIVHDRAKREPQKDAENSHTRLHLFAVSSELRALTDAENRGNHKSMNTAGYVEMNGVNKYVRSDDP
jgi:hypothetical protein